MPVFVIIPTYNEKENLTSIIEGVFSHLPESNILIVDDNSPDGTGLLADELGKKYAGRLECLHRSRKDGLGPAYIAGFQYALSKGAQKLIQMDADLSHPVEILPRMVELSNRYDVVIGSRYTQGGSTPDWPFRRRLLSRWANFYARTILSLALCDVTTGFRCFNRRVIESIDLSSIQTRGYGFLVELVYRAYRKGYSFIETPIVFRDRTHGQSKMGLSIALEAAVKVFRMRREGGG